MKGKRQGRINIYITLEGESGKITIIPMKSWITNWDAITPIFKFSSDVRTIIYTTNAIESLIQPIEN